MTQQKSQLLLMTPPVSAVSHTVHACTHELTLVFYTGIADLFKVRTFLKNLVDWEYLGQALGLLYPTLKKIKEEQHGVVDKCKMEMLAAWLQQQDNVTDNGVPSWSILKTALVNIGENELADTITT